MMDERHPTLNSSFIIPHSSFLLSCLSCLSLLIIPPTITYSLRQACEQRDGQRRQDFRERERAVACGELAPGENVAEAPARESDERERRVGPRLGAQTQRPFAPRAEPREETRGDGD